MRACVRACVRLYVRVQHALHLEPVAQSQMCGLKFVHVCMLVCATVLVCGAVSLKFTGKDI